MKLTVGSCPDSWGVWFADDPRQTPWSRCLDEIAAVGYRWTELGPLGYLPTNIPQLKRELAARNLNVIASVVLGHLENCDHWPQIEADVLKAGELLAAVNARYLVLIDDVYTDLHTGEIKFPPQLDPSAWSRLIECTDRMGRLCLTRFGLKLVFHPHAQCHVQFEDQIELLLKQTDPIYVNLNLDTGHHAYCGGDPVAFMRKHHQRIPYLHLKSVDGAIQKKVEQEKIPFGKAVAMDMFCEPSQGVVDFIAFRDVLREINYEGFAMVEQDMYPAPFDKPLPIAKRTFAYLRSIGMIV
jgi:inosose dehydratase